MDSKRKLVKAAIKLFARNGYHKTTMDMIAQEAELSKGSLYWYFSSKDDLLKGIIELAVSDFFTFVEELRNNQKLKASDKIRETILFRLKYFKEHQSLGKIIMSNLEGIDHDFKELMFSLKEKSIKFFLDLINEGVSTGEFEVKDPRMAAISLLGMLNAVTTHPFLFKQKKDQEIADILLDLIINGIGSRQT